MKHHSEHWEGTKTYMIPREHKLGYGQSSEKHEKQ